MLFPTFNVIKIYVEIYFLATSKNLRITDLMGDSHISPMKFVIDGRARQNLCSKLADFEFLVVKFRFHGRKSPYLGHFIFEI